MPDKFHRWRAWPPNKGLINGHPLEYTMPGSFQDMNGICCGFTGLPERHKASTTEKADTSNTLRGIFHFRTSSIDKVVVHRSGSGITNGIYELTGGNWSSIRDGDYWNPSAGSAPNVSFAQMGDWMYVAGFDDNGGLSPTTSLFRYDGTNWLHAKVEQPDISSMSLTGGTGGSLTEDYLYRYRVTFVDDDGWEGPPNDVNPSGLIDLSSSQNKVSLSSIPTGGATIAKRKIYRTRGQATAIDAANATYYLLTTINDNSTTTYTDTTADDDLDLTTASPAYNSGYPSGTGPTNVISWAGRLWTWGMDRYTVRFSGRPPATNESRTLSQASTDYGLYEPLYWHYSKSVGGDEDALVALVPFGARLYALKHQSIWVLDNRGLEPGVWQFVPVANKGCVSSRACCATEHGIWFLSHSHGKTDLMLFDGQTVRPGYSDAIYGSLTAYTNDEGVLFPWQGQIIVGDPSQYSYAYSPARNLWSLWDNEDILYAYVAPEWSSTSPKVWYIDEVDGPTLKSISSGSDLRSGSGFVANSYVTTNRINGGNVDTPNEFHMVRLQVSTSAATDITLSGRVENQTSWTTIREWEDIDAPNGDILEAGLPVALARGRWIELKVTFTNDTWARLDGLTVEMTTDVFEGQEQNA